MLATSCVATADDVSLNCLELVPSCARCLQTVTTHVMLIRAMQVLLRV
jgi:hypothetical protein